MIILGCALVTLLPRVVPLVLLSRFQLPQWLTNWLKHIPVSIMSALLAQELLLENGNFSLDQNIHDLLAAIPTFLIAIITRSLLITVLVGIITITLLRMVL